jgi:hypothetical protein
MKLWIICTGEPENIWPGRCTAEEFERIAELASQTGSMDREERKLNGEEMLLLAAPCAAARRTAELCVSGAELREEPLLRPVELRAFRDGAKHSPRVWREMAKLQRKFGSPRQPEKQRQLSARAEELLSRLEEKERDCILIADCVLVKELLDRARIRGYAQARSGIFAYRPWERILLTRRDLHCGGCGHNCLLSNPGCGVGRDKAARKSK